MIAEVEDRVRGKCERVGSRVRVGCEASARGSVVGRAARVGRKASARGSVVGHGLQSTETGGGGTRDTDT